jgi:hypothetical protein
MAGAGNVKSIYIAAPLVYFFYYGGKAVRPTTDWQMTACTVPQRLVGAGKE